jgi:putative two-component system response regulator
LEGITEDQIKGAQILIVDDAQVNAALLRKFLENDGYTRIAYEADPWKVVDVVEAVQPDVILLDIHMPQLDGFGVMKLLDKEVALKAEIPIVIVSADASPETTQRALAAGVFDFVGKPFEESEISLRVRNAVKSRLLSVAVNARSEGLLTKVRTRTRELEDAQTEILDRLGLAAEYRDDDTGEHTRRVGRTSGRMARAIGISPNVASLIERAAPLHDVGKIGIPDSILLKPGRLTDAEMEIMKTHTTIGARIISGTHPLLWLAGEIALNHHERWDGGGYPAGLAGEDIPRPGRIVHLADVFDTLLHKRSYKRAWPKQEAISEILAQSGTQFDPRVVEGFLRVVNLPDEDEVSAAQTAE